MGTMIYGTIRRSNWNNASIGLENKKEQFQSKLYYPKQGLVSSFNATSPNSSFDSFLCSLTHEFAE